MKPSYTMDERKEIRRWSEETVKLYQENIDKHGMSPADASVHTLDEIDQALEVDTEEFKPTLNTPGPIQGCKVCGSKLVMIRGRIPHQPDREVCACCAVEKLEEIDFQRRMAEQGPCQASQ